MQNRWKKAGCIRRWLSPSGCSHPCHPRRVQWMRAAASDCVRPAASLAALTSCGVGLRAALPARLRFGWLGIFCNFNVSGLANMEITPVRIQTSVSRNIAIKHPGFMHITCLPMCGYTTIFENFTRCYIRRALNAICVNNEFSRNMAEHSVFAWINNKFSHFNLLCPQYPRRGVGRANDSHYTRIAYKVNSFSGRKISPLTCS